MKVKTMVSTLIFLIVLNLGVLGTIIYLNVADRQPPIARFLNPEPRFEPPIRGPMMRIEDLTSEQEHQMMQLVESFQSEIEPLHQEIRSLEQQMFDELTGEGEADTIITEEILTNIADLRLEISRHALRHLQESKTFLSEDQQKSFIRRIMSAGRRPAMGPGPNRPNPPMLNRPFENQ